MSRRSRRTAVAAAAALVLLAAAEVGLNLLLGGRAPVEVINDGAEPIEGLVATLGDDRVEVPRLPPGASTVLRVGGRGAGPRTLALRFRQRGNALGAYELPGFDPEALRRDGRKQVLRVRTNEVERYLDDDDAPATPAGRLARRVRQGFESSLEEIADPR